MIQRIQTIYLIITLVLGALLFKVPFYYFEHSKFITPPMMEQSMLPIAAGICLISVIAIFTYKRRKLQINICRCLILSELAYLVAGFINSRAYNNAGFDFKELRLGALLPVISIILIVLAIRSIRKDEELIRSMDRLR